ncbi:hypothetical protein F5B20DRAFT_575328 [Whalleya microplaca]|nr:hypothetical protein F5B20DRAFT_575328 [Whalleya microplaca]
MKILTQSLALGLFLLTTPTTLALPQSPGATPTSPGSAATWTGAPEPWNTDAAVVSAAVAAAMSAVPSPTPAPSSDGASSDSGSKSSSSFTSSCDYRFCTESRDVCFYWGGYTSWDVSRGPIPGEVVTILGSCTDG